MASLRGLVTCLAELLDLPPELAYKEAQSKLTGTIVKINGTLTFLGEIGSSVSQIKQMPPVGDAVLRNSAVGTLELWLPETGVYVKRGTTSPIFLQRVPLRQWKMSFSESFYKLHTLSSAQVNPLTIDPDSRTDFWVSPGGIIYYHAFRVGHWRNSSSFVCENPLFEQEIRDWLEDPHGYAHYQKLWSKKENNGRNNETG